MENVQILTSHSNPVEEQTILNNKSQVTFSLEIAEPEVTEKSMGIQSESCFNSGTDNQGTMEKLIRIGSQSSFKSGRNGRTDTERLVKIQPENDFDVNAYDRAEMERMMKSRSRNSFNIAIKEQEDAEDLLNMQSENRANIRNNNLQDTDKLIRIRSENSFNVETNELTVTHVLSGRRLSKMRIKQLENNTMDIVITNANENDILASQVIGSRDISIYSKYSGCAKLGLMCVLFVLVVMLIVMVIALLGNPGFKTGDINTYNSSVNIHSIEPFINATFLENSTSSIH